MHKVRSCVCAVPCRLSPPNFDPRTRLRIATPESPTVGVVFSHTVTITVTATMSSTIPSPSHPHPYPPIAILSSFVSVIPPPRQHHPASHPVATAVSFSSCHASPCSPQTPHRGIAPDVARSMQASKRPHPTLTDELRPFPSGGWTGHISHQGMLLSLLSLLSLLCFPHADQTHVV